MIIDQNQNPSPTAAHAGPVLSSSTLTGDSVRNPEGEDLGDIKDLMIDTASGNVEYAVLSFGGFLGLGDKLFALPWPALKLDDSVLNYALLNESATRVAGLLKEKGVAPGELARSPQRHDPLIPGSFYNLSRTVGPV